MILDLLARASIGGAIVVALVWVLNRALPGLPAGTRAFLWWCAAAKFVVVLLWTTPVLVPVLPAPDRDPGSAPIVRESANVELQQSSRRAPLRLVKTGVSRGRRSFWAHGRSAAVSHCSVASADGEMSGKRFVVAPPPPPAFS